jgi:hypothetical protein
MSNKVKPSSKLKTSESEDHKDDEDPELLLKPPSRKINSLKAALADSIRMEDKRALEICKPGFL